MPLPEPTQILATIDELITARINEDHHALFEFSYLLDHVRRTYNSTTPAVRARLFDLIEEGDLVQVRVSHQGYVRLTEELGGGGMWSLYFAYYAPRQYVNPRNWGLVTTTRQGEIENVWANGDRWLYTTRSRFDKMVTHFTEEKAKSAERRRQRAEEQETHFWELAEAADPDIRQVLAELEKAVPQVDVTHTLRPARRDEASDRLCVSIDVRDAGQLSALLAVLRRGLA